MLNVLKTVLNCVNLMKATRLGLVSLEDDAFASQTSIGARLDAQADRGVYDDGDPEGGEAEQEVHQTAARLGLAVEVGGGHGGSCLRSRQRPLVYGCRSLCRLCQRLSEQERSGGLSGLAFWRRSGRPPQ